MNTKGIVKVIGDGLGKFVKSSLPILKKKAPDIAIAAGVASIPIIGITSGRASIQAYKLVKDAENELGRKLTKKEIIKLCWKFYIIPVFVGVGSSACIIGGVSVKSHRSAKELTALTIAHELSETKNKVFDEYREKVKSEMGAEKEKDIHQKAEEEVQRKKDFECREMRVNVEEVYPVFEPLSGNYILTNKKELEDAACRINRDMSTSTSYYVGVLDWLYDIGIASLPKSQRDHLSQIGWRLRNGDGYLRFRVVPADNLMPDGRPAATIEYINPPVMNYDR